MKKKLLALLLIGCMAFSVAACGGDENSSGSDEATQEEVKTTEKTLDAISKELGLTKTTDKAAEMIGAAEGAGYEMDGYDGGIELYIYEDTDSDMYKDITSGEDELFSAAGVNDGVVLLFSMGDEPNEDLVERFEALNLE